MTLDSPSHRDRLIILLREVNRSHLTNEDGIRLYVSALIPDHPRAIEYVVFANVPGCWYIKLTTHEAARSAVLAMQKAGFSASLKDSLSMSSVTRVVPRSDSESLVPNITFDRDSLIRLFTTFPQAPERPHDLNDILFNSSHLSLLSK